MTLDEARAIVGRTNCGEPWLSNMIRALQMLPLLNTPEENLRLEAAKLVKSQSRRVSK